MKRIVVVCFAAYLSATAAVAAAQEIVAAPANRQAPVAGNPVVSTMSRATGANIDLRTLPAATVVPRQRPRRLDPPVTPTAFPGTTPAPSAPVITAPSAAAPAPIRNFDGLDFATWGAGHPPDTNGDVGPTYYVQVVNSAIGIFRKSDGVRMGAFTFDTLMAQGHFGNLCDTDNFGDPVVLYDSFEDRWVLTDFAFQLDGSGNVVNPPGAYQCFAVSKTSDPVAGGWYFYSLHVTGGLNDYAKFGIWPDGLYMSANMFDYAATGSYQNVRAWAFNKAQMYAGVPAIQIVEFNAPAAEFTMLPANARLQTGTPPPGTPNYFSVVWQNTNAISFYKFHVDWTSAALSTFTGPFTAIAPASWSNAPSTVPELGGNALDTLATRLMMQNRYSNIAGVESLWNTHTVLGAAAGTAAPRYYQVVVTGGTVAAATTQAATFTPDATVSRFVPSVAVDRAGNMALGYSATSATIEPAIRYAGRLAGDPLNTLPQTETSLIEGTGAQVGSCGGTCTRWGDYSAMTVDTDGCTFWYTNEYYALSGLSYLTRIGSFKYPGCTPVATGALLGTVTAAAGGAAVAGASVALGSRTTTTDGTGAYAFIGLPSGTYPSLTVTAPGFNTATVNSIVVTDAVATTQNFALVAAPVSACLLDTTLADFRAGTSTSVDVAVSPNNVVLQSSATIDQQNTTLSTSGLLLSPTIWGGQTFTPAVSGPLTRVDINLFCSGCTGTSPDLTLSVRATSGGLPTGADLASATITGFTSGSATFYTTSFTSPPTLTAGTLYALVIRPVANPSAGSYALTRSAASVYASGVRISSANSGGSWTAQATDVGFKTYTGYAASGTFVSSLKDSNPAAGNSPRWTSLAWTAATPANTVLRFQAAASNAAAGPFAFVGPDGTAATFFSTSGASLSQFNGNRYLQYKAYLSNTSTAVTPVLNDVTTCYKAAPDLSISDVTHLEGNSGTTSYIFTVSLSAPAGAAGVTFDIATADGTALAPGDYTAKALTNQVIPAGAVSYGFNVLVNGDLVKEADETFFVNVTNITNALAVDTQAIGTIQNDDSNADLAVTKLDTPDPVTAGNNLSWTIAVTNAGPDSAASAVLSDTLPAGTTFVSLAAAGGWSCTTPAVGAAGTVSCTNASFAVGNATFTLAVKVGAAVSSGTVLSNTASVSSATTDANPANNSATATTTVAAAADLSITKVDTPDPVTAGTNLSWTITVTNAGPSSAASAVLSDTLPAGTTFVSLAAAGGWSCTMPAVGAAGAISCSNAIFAVGNATFTLVAQVGVGVASGTVLSNTASVSAETTDANPANNSATATTTVAAAADLSITKVDTPDPVTAGNNLTWTISVANAGPSNAATATLSDTLPAGTTFVSLAPAGGWSCTTPAVGATGAISCSNASFAVGNATFTLVAQVGAGVASGTVLSNTASVSSATTDANPANNSATATTTVAAAADLSITNVDTPDPVIAGNNLTWTITAANAGPSNAATATLSDTLPAGTTFVSLAPAGGWSCTTPAVGATGAISCSNASFAVGNATFTLVAQVGAGVASGTVLSNTASVSSATTDSNPANNSATATTTVAAAADLAVTNIDTPDPVTAGSNLTYAITVTNAGPSIATSVTLSDTLPAGTTFVSLSSPVGWSCTTPDVGAAGIVSCSNASLAVGDAAFSLVVRVGAAVPDGTVLSNTATAASAAADPTPGNDAGVATTTVGASADLSLTKLGAPDPVRAGRALTYTLSLHNAGPSDAASPELSDPLPAGLTFASIAGPAGWNCTAPAVGATGSVSCTAAALAVGDSASFTLTTTVGLAAPAGTVVANTATVSAATGDANPADNSATATALVANAGIDIDADGQYGALTDGLLALRYLFGFAGTALTDNALGMAATRILPEEIKAFLDATRLQFDIDGNGQVDALTDGLLLLRYLAGVRGDALIVGAIGDGATRLLAIEIETYIESLLP